jgi:type II secretory ATPase GspE/PulE/Tfp pilus assembly ATPase PilB-like protein
MRELIREKASMAAIRAEARKVGMLYMREEALRLLARGITSIGELQRVVK